jgi:hypothetical protein
MSNNFQQAVMSTGSVKRSSRCCESTVLEFFLIPAGGGKRQVGVNLWGDSPVYMNPVSDLCH